MAETRSGSPEREATGPATGLAIYYGAPQRQALRHLHDISGRTEGLFLLTGDDGVGKTTILRLFLGEQAPRHQLRFYRQADQLIGGDLEIDLVDALNAHLGPDLRAKSLKRLRKHLSETNQQICLVLDDADRLSRQQLDAIFHLITPQEEQTPIQMIMAGETSLRKRLYGDDAKEVRERIIAAYHMPPLAPQDVSGLAAFLITQAEKVFAGFTDNALETLVDLTGGLPGKVAGVVAALIPSIEGKDKPVTRKDLKRLLQRVAKLSAGKKAKSTSTDTIGPTPEDLNMALERLAEIDLPEEDIWEPAHRMSVIESEKLDRIAIRRCANADSPLLLSLEGYLTDTQLSLSYLRSTLMSLDEETRRLAQRHASVRQRRRHRIDLLMSRLRDLRAGP